MRVTTILGQTLVAVGSLACMYAAFVAFVSLDLFAEPTAHRPATPPGTALSFLPFLLVGIALVVVGRQIRWWVGKD